MYYGARWPRSAPERGYDPALGRFAQADSIVPGGVQGYDRYAYVSNDPIRYVDPDGHKECDPQLGCSGRLPSPKHPAPESSASSTSPYKGRNSNDDNCKGLGCAVSQYGSSAATIPTDISTVATATSVPNWRKIALGVSVLLAVDILIVTPIVIGVVLTPGALEATMLVTETGWVTAFAAVVVTTNVYGIKLIIEGAQGQ